MPFVQPITCKSFSMQVFNAKIFVCLTGMIIYAGSAYSQACCTAGVPVSGNLGITQRTPKELQFMLTYDYNHVSDLRNGSERLKNDPRIRAAHTVMLETGYSFTSRFSASILVSYITQTRNVSLFEDNPDFQSAHGFGDIVLLPKYALLPGKKRALDSWLIIGAGPKFPTGSTERVNEAGLLLSADMQPGSGSWDGIFWLYFSQQHVFKPNLNFLFNATYTLTGVNDNLGLGNFKRSFQFGREFQVSAGFTDNFLVRKIFLNPSVLFKYRTITANRENDFDVPNTGGHWLLIIPSLTLEFTQQFSARIFSEVPVFRKLEGTQINTAFRAGISFLYKISFEKNPIEPDIIN